MKVTDTAEITMWETFNNGFRYTIVATRLPFNLVVAGGAMGTHYIWTMWLGREEPFTTVAMMPEYAVDVEYMLRSNEHITRGQLDMAKEILIME